jgi:hypothetical protein
MSDKPSFFSELKRRNVYKVAVANEYLCDLVFTRTAGALKNRFVPDFLAS